MKKIFTLIFMAMIAMSVNAQTEESYVAIDADQNFSAEYAGVIGEGGVATNVSNGSSIVKFSTANVDVEAVGSAEPADLADGGQDITIGALINEAEHTYELVSINSTKPIKWEKGNRGDINYWYVKGTGTPAVSMVAEEIYTNDQATGKYRVKVTTFDPAVGGEPASGLYYKFTTKVDGALKVGIWANKGNRTTFLVDSESKIPSEYLLEGYLEGQTYKTDKPRVDGDGNVITDDDGNIVYQDALKWLSNTELKAIHDASGQASNPWVIGDGKNFWGNVVIDAKAGKTYWLFQGNSQIGFQGYTFYPGKSKEDVITGIETIKTVPENANAPMYNLAGQKVSKDYKGVKVQNGKKFM